MVVRTRLGAIVTPILFYALAGVASAYFIDTAVNGERGLKTKEEYRRGVASVTADLDALKADRAQWEHRISLLRSEAIDQDLLAEQARAKLDYVDPRDLVVFNRTASRSVPAN